MTTQSEATEELEQGKYSSIPMGRKLAEHLAGSVIFVPEIGWHAWDKTRWRRVHEDEVLARAANWVEKELMKLLASNTDIRAALKYREVHHLRNLLAGARTAEGEHNIVVSAAQLDAREGLLNCANGVLDLRSGKLRPHNPQLFMTKSTGVAYVAGSTHDDLTKALAALPDDEAARYLQTFVGAAATGERDRGGPILFQQGDGANGKTTVIDAITHALGDYAVQLPDKLISGRGDEHDTQWMPLQGARLVTVEELPEGHQLPVAKMKKLADTPHITARYMHRDYVTFPATHSMIVNTNYRPRVTETDHGTWRRLVMIDYARTFTGVEKDNTLKRRMRQTVQAQAVLAWIAQGARQWYANDRGLGVLPQTVAAATAQWRDESDPLAVFLTDELEFTTSCDDRIPTAALLTKFNASLPVGAKPWSSALFGSRLRAHHLVKERSASVDRGKRGRERNALTKVVWKQVAQGAPGQSDDSHESDLGNLWNAPVHPVHPHEMGASTHPEDAADRLPTRLSGGDGSLLRLLSVCESCGVQTVSNPCRSCAPHSLPKVQAAL